MAWINDSRLAHLILVLAASKLALLSWVFFYSIIQGDQTSQQSHAESTVNKTRANKSLLEFHESVVSCSDCNLSTSFLEQLAQKANVPTFKEQNRTMEFIKILQLELGEQTAQSYVSPLIFYLSMGKEEYINILLQNSSTCDNARLGFGRLIDEIMTAFIDLYNSGGRKFVLVGFHPIGCTPRATIDMYITRLRKNTALKATVNQINSLIRLFNQLLNERVMDLNLEFSDAGFVFCDIYEGILEILFDPHFQGIVDANGGDWCEDVWHGAIESKNVIEDCSQLSSHVWWDFYSHSEAVTSLLAESAWSGEPLSDICRPANIRELLNM